MSGQCIHKKIVRLGSVFFWFCFLTFVAGPHVVSHAQPATTGFHVDGRSLLDANGKDFIMRGINHPHAWYPTRTGAFGQIKATGANTIRVVLSSGHLWTRNSASDVASVINLCKTNKLVCVLDAHDTIGYGEQEGAATLAQAVDYWKSIQSVLTGQEAYVIINIGNEPFGNNDPDRWVNATKDAIAAMRSAGFHHTLMVDAPNWGQDWQFIMRDNAASLFESDPDKNTLFSIHMYGVFDTAAEIESYVSFFASKNLPLVIGEFGWKHSDGDPLEASILAIAKAYGIGYLAWSWSGNSGGVEYLDLVTNFNPNLRTWWGNRVISGKHGICPTSEQASVYGSEPVGPKKCSLILFSVGAKDGWALETAETSSKGGLRNSNAATFNLGDDASNRQYRAILHFGAQPLPLPGNAVITNARLKIKSAGLAGTDPFKTHGGLQVDSRKPYFGSNALLESLDFQARAGQAAIGTFGPTPSMGWYVASLSTGSFLPTDFESSIQFRLRFKKDDNNDHGADYAKFYSGNAPATQRPVLVITYTIP